MEKKKKVLIVDDEVDIVKTLTYILEREGYAVYGAVDGTEGLEKVTQHMPDLIILDLRLPLLPGEEVCRRIRKDEATAKIPIIMLTAKDLDVDRVIGKVIGANYYITKPFDIKDLLGKIKSLI
ncbi:MAG: response regulator [Candidatus Omnitrophota bacterium]|nr:MAG: response regulator [Candidatus Omnitrophota bacterium]